MTKTMTETDMKYGFWAQSPDQTQGYPWPVVSIKPNPDFLDRVAIVEAEACKLVRFRGVTGSRLTGKTLGGHEFVLSDRVSRTEVRWPGDYASHYLAAGVAPEPGFVALIEQVYANLPAPGPEAPRPWSGPALR